VRSWPGLHAVVITGHADTDASDMLRGYTVLRKPFTMVALARLLDELTPVVAGDVS
jgi:hypothetical protein